MRNTKTTDGTQDHIDNIKLFENKLTKWHKSKKIDQNSAAVKQPNAKNGLSKQLLSNFQTENSSTVSNSRLKSKIALLIKKSCVFGKFSEMGAGTENGQFGLDYGHKIQSSIQSNIWLWSNR